MSKKNHGSQQELNQSTAVNGNYNYTKSRTGTRRGENTISLDGPFCNTNHSAASNETKGKEIMPSVTGKKAGKKSAISDNKAEENENENKKDDKNEEDEEEYRGHNSGAQKAYLEAVAASQKQTIGTTDNIFPLSIAPVVSPEKASLQTRSESPIQEKTFYIVHTETFSYSKFESRDDAMNFYETTRKFNPDLADKMRVMDFVNDLAMTQYIDAMMTLSGKKKLAKNPMAMTAKPAINPMAANATSLPVIVRNAAIDRPPDIQAGSPASKRPKLAFSCGSDTSGTNDIHMKRFDEAMKNSNSKMDTWHLILEGSTYDVWGFSLKEGEDYYWSWKPTVLEKAIMAEQEYRLFEQENTTLDDMLCYVRAANIRKTPCGPNIPSAFVMKTGKSMDHMTLFGLINSPSTEADVRNTLLSLCNHFKNAKVQMAYSKTFDTILKSDGIKKDARPGGLLWEKIAAASNNINYRRLNCLSQVLCDNAIESIIRATYGYGGGISPSMWDRRVYNLAFGEANTTE